MRVVEYEFGQLNASISQLLKVVFVHGPVKVFQSLQSGQIGRGTACEIIAVGHFKTERFE